MHDKLDFIDMARGVCHVGHVPYEDVYFSSLFRGCYIGLSKKLRSRCPNKPTKPDMSSGDKLHMLMYNHHKEGSMIGYLIWILLLCIHQLLCL